MTDKELFIQNFPNLAEHADKLEQLINLLLEKNKVLNLTSIVEVPQVWSKHIFDSLMLADFLKSNPLILEVADVGTGGGFPGLPLAICFEYKNFTLIDSTRKKTEAVADFISELSLPNAKVEWARSQELSRNFAFKNQFDLALARAVGYLPQLIEDTFSLVKSGGYFAFYKVVNEIEMADGDKVAKRLGITLNNRVDYKLANEDMLRTILIYRKS
jgi:16S rRNA (guanine527-N7)-methyltransferase